MKAKELMNLLRSAVDQEVYVTFVGYDIHDYLDGDETEVICSFRSDFKCECFLNEAILNEEVVSIGLKSNSEIVFELSEDWDAQKVVDIRCPSKTLDVGIAKNEFGLTDVTIKDLEEDDMIELLANICLQFNLSGITDKDGKWKYTFDEENEGGDDNGKQ